MFLVNKLLYFVALFLIFNLLPSYWSSYYSLVNWVGQFLKTATYMQFLFRGRGVWGDCSFSLLLPSRTTEVDCLLRIRAAWVSGGTLCPVSLNHTKARKDSTDSASLPRFLHVIVHKGHTFGLHSMFFTFRNYVFFPSTLKVNSRCYLKKSILNKK